MQNCVRTNISLTKGLYAKMKRARGHNWSRIASEAFLLVLEGGCPIEIIAELRKENEELRNVLRSINQITELK